jgi:hypothetical protein
MQKLLKIGVIGYSGRPFDKSRAKIELEKVIKHLSTIHKDKTIEIVSGYTNIGVPRIAYLIADELNLTTVGFSAKEALGVDCGLYPVKKIMIIGEKFGDESKAFIDYINVLIRIGGGNQSLIEVALFKDKKASNNLDSLLYEVELEELK